MTLPVPAHNPLLAEVRQLIDAARQRVASAVNAELTQLYWHIGHRINAELLQGQRAEYGKQVVAELARQLTVDFGKGWSEQQLRHCMRLAEIFVDEQILSTVRRELSWSHLKTLIYIDTPLKRDFYIEICRLEHWSVRQLQERINSLLFERTAISKKPEEIPGGGTATFPRHCERSVAVHAFGSHGLLHCVRNDETCSWKAQRGNPCLRSLPQPPSLRAKRGNPGAMDRHVPSVLAMTMREPSVQPPFPSLRT